MKKSTKIILISISSLPLIAIFLWYTVSVTCLDCGHTSATVTEMKVREAFKAPFFKFKVDTGRYPTTGEGIEALVENKGIAGWKGPYIRNMDDALDAWGQHLQYVCPGIQNKDTYDLYSFGPDGIESQDDITNWKKE